MLSLMKVVVSICYCGLMHTIACSRHFSVLASCWAKWQQHSGRDRTIKHCNSLLLLSLCLKGNVTVTYHVTILSILKVKEYSVIKHIHTLLFCCLWTMDQSYYVILLHIKLGLVLDYLK